MFLLVVLLSPIVSAIGPGGPGGLRGPAGMGGPGALAGYSPTSSGGFYPNGIAPNVYSGFYPQGRGRQVAGAGEYQRGGQEGGYRNYAQNARGNEVIRDAGGLASRDSDGWSGNQMVARGGAGAEGYYKDAEAARYNQAGNAATGAATKYGAAGQDGYDGYGDEGYQKGHKTSGFHKSYHDIETGKDTKYVDEDHNMANQKFGQGRDAAYGNNGWGVSGKGQDEGLHAERVAHDAGAHDAIRAGGAHRAGYGSHDINGYHHNQDLAHKRGQELAEDHRLVRDGLHGMRANNGAIYNNELW